MDGSSGGGIQLSSAKRDGNSDSFSVPTFNGGLAFMLGPSGDLQRNWRINVAPLSTDSNALVVQYRDGNGFWQTASVFTARPT